MIKFMSHNIKFSCISSTSICFLSNQHSVCSTHCSVISKISYFISFPYILYSNDCIQLNIFIICNSVSSKCIFIIIIRFLEICKRINRIPAISHLYQRILSIIHYFRMVSSRLLVIITALLPCFRAFCTFFSAKCAIFSYFFRKLLLFFTKNIVFGGFLPVFCIFRHISVEIVQQRCI